MADSPSPSRYRREFFQRWAALDARNAGAKSRAAKPSAPMKKLRLMLVDDQSLFREALHTLLALQEGFEIVAEAANAEQAFRR